MKTTLTADSSGDVIVTLTTETETEQFIISQINSWNVDVIVSKAKTKSGNETETTVNDLILRCVQKHLETTIEQQS